MPTDVAAVANCSGPASDRPDARPANASSRSRSDHRGLRVVHVTEAWTGGIATYTENLISYQLDSGRFSKVTLLCSRIRTPAVPVFPGHAGYEVLFYDTGRDPWRVVSDSWWKLVFGVAPDHDGCSIRRRGQSAA